MRKKLLALLMCATMVLGTAATAMAATPSGDDYTNAKKILEAYTGQDIDDEIDAKASQATFTTVYQDSTPTVVSYTWAFTEGLEAVKVSSSSTKTALTKTSGLTIDFTAKDDAAHTIVMTTKSKLNGTEVTNPSAQSVTLGTTQAEFAAALNGAVLKDSANGDLYYATATKLTTATALTAGQYVLFSTAPVDDDADYSADPAQPGTYVVTLKAFTKADTGSVSAGSDAAKDDYGIDKDGYINLQDSTVKLLEATSKIADGYYAIVKKADAKNITAVAQALADGTISKNAAAVQITFYKMLGSTTSQVTTKQGTTNTPAYAVANASQTGFQTLVEVTADIKDTTVKFNTDWLSRSNAKNANVVYLLDPLVTSVTSYFQQISTVWKFADYTDGAFTSKYIASGTYIFDYNEDASQNDGVSDTDTTATTAAAASTTAATSPKTGDVAPIAALAVVMMGACGAMVVASKKRA
jgi:hypothetical protein